MLKAVLLGTVLVLALVVASLFGGATKPQPNQVQTNVLCEACPG